MGGMFLSPERYVISPAVYPIWIASTSRATPEKLTHDSVLDGAPEETIGTGPIRFSSSFVGKAN